MQFLIVGITLLHNFHFGGMGGEEGICGYDRLERIPFFFFF